MKGKRMSTLLKGLYILSPGAFDKIYGEEERSDVQKLIDIYAPPQTPETVRENLSLIGEAEVVLSGWGGPKMDEAFLAAASNLKAVFYGAGSIKGMVTDAFWDRGIRITSAYGANAVPVAEYTLSQILFCLKKGWQHALTIKKEGKYCHLSPVHGAYESTVGVISLGMIGRHVARLLQHFDLEVLAYDPYVSPEVAAELKVTLCGLDEIFRRSHVVTLHTPRLKETMNMIRGDHFASMMEGATFINTSRGAVVCEPEMIKVLQERPDLFAVLDVTQPEPPGEGSPLYSLPNVILTPHIAGSMDGECRRMGRYMVEELERYLVGKPLVFEITREMSPCLA
jgi:phosphoglycerate dehydrogenase-like enzyme